MAIPRQAIEKVVASHPDTALVGVPVSLLREILAILPVDVLKPHTVPVGGSGAALA